MAPTQSPTIAIVFSPNGATPPEVVRDWLAGVGLTAMPVSGADELLAVCLRGRPRVVVFDGRGDQEQTCAACRRLKRDSFTGIIPAVMIVADSDDACRHGFDAGADEVLRLSLSNDEAAVRLSVLLRRSDRDTFVHPSTRLPGTGEIEADITRRLALAEPFAVCYADLDHFKEFNDRYSYNDGDRVIRILAKILHDVVKGICGEQGFVGHIGGDDFIFNVPATAVADTCGEVIAVFDALVPYQYSEQDRRAGYFFGKDRRGQLHRVPLMTVSIGVVTNERRTFVHAAQMSELATEMKSYAKTLDGSLYTVDRRQDGVAEPPIVIPRPISVGEKE
ncbi:MAG TPA: diguanylate cyclase [Gemmatimonadaceae bacterium]|jgi:diguanylate cyclase (GGDEF)-like protein|nr:diguanylate cyclase [Gemmatimonadaceae bacterium]